MDPIRRQLELLELEDTRRSSRLDHIFSTCPLLPLAAGLIAGIVLQQHISLPIWWPISILACCLITAAFSYLLANPDPRLKMLVAAAIVAFACLGGIRLTLVYEVGSEDISNFVGDERTLATIGGTVVTEVRTQDKDSWAFGKFLWGEPSSSFYLDVDEVKTAGGFEQISGRVRVQISGQVADIAPGDQVRMYCWLSRLSPPSNPGQFDFGEYLKRRKVLLTASVNDSNGIELIAKGAEVSLLGFRQRLRQMATDALLNERTPDDSTAITAALILGDRSRITAEVTEAFRKTGLAHFISLSGMHLGMLAGSIWWLSTRTGLSKRWRAVVTMLLIGLYLLIVPSRAPTLRAGFICFIFCCSAIMLRKPNSINTLSFAAIILLLLKPADIFLAGWQLSFTTVLSILVFQKPIKNFLLTYTLDRWQTSKDLKANIQTYHEVAKSLCASMIELASVGIAAWIGAAGILLYHFGIVTPLAGLWTVLVLPLVLAILAFGFLKMLLAAILPTLSAILSVVVSSLADSLIYVVKAIAVIDVTAMSFGEVTVWVVILFYLLGMIWVFGRFRNTMVKRVILTVMAAMLIGYLGNIKWQQHHRQNLTLTVLDVGHGQSILAELPGGKNLLFDCGSLTHKNVGTNIVRPLLLTKGIGRLDAIFISHDDIDHLNGVPEVVSTFDVDNVFVNWGFIENSRSSSTASYLNQTLAELGTPLTAVEDDFVYQGKANLLPLWPGKEICDDPGIGDNDKSQVYVIEFAGRRVLLTSDIEMLAQKAILEKYPDLDVDVILMPHHGSRANLVDGFAQQLKAETIVVSCSKGRHASAYKTKNAVKGFYTPVDGAVTICISADGQIVTSGFKSN